MLLELKKKKTVRKCIRSTSIYVRAPSSGICFDMTDFKISTFFKSQLLMWYPGKTSIFEENLILNPKSKYSENMSIIVICVLKMSQTVTFFIFNLLTIYGEFFIHTFKLSNKKLQFKICINQRALSTTPNLQQTTVFNLYTIFCGFRKYMSRQ